MGLGQQALSLMHIGGAGGRPRKNLPLFLFRTALLSTATFTRCIL